MKKICSLLIASFILIASAQGQKASWKEMKEFHTVMSETFHPAEEGKLGPIKSRSQEMVDKAVVWQKSEVPEGYDKKEVKKLLKKLVDGSKELNKMIKDNADDKAITDKLSGLHDVFHEIMEKGGGHH